MQWGAGVHNRYELTVSCLNEYKLLESEILRFVNY